MIPMPMFANPAAFLLSKFSPQLARYWIWHMLSVAQVSTLRFWILFALWVVSISAEDKLTALPSIAGSFLAGY
jgi:hypothetical protein